MAPTPPFLGSASPIWHESGTWGSGCRGSFAGRVVPPRHGASVTQVIIHATLGHALSRSATHPPAATASAVWAAHLLGAVARDRHRPRVNATTNATTQVTSPAQPPFRACRAACTGLPRYGGSVGSSCRSGVPPVIWGEVSVGVLADPSPRSTERQASGVRGVRRGGSATDRSRRVQVRVDPVGAEGTSVVPGGFPELSGQCRADDRRAGGEPASRNRG